MAKRPSEAALRAAKEAKQKKLLLLLVPLFLALAAWQGPKTFKALRGGPPPPPPVEAAATPTPPSATTTGAQPSGDGAALPDTDVQPDLLDGQLLSFSRFYGDDPFEGLHSPGFGSGSSATEETATVEVNGTSEDLGIDDSFPANDPTFKLVSVTATSANIGLVSGAFSNGAETIAINVGETLVLVADDGARYAIKLVSVAA
jgi:hypothetical protein